eukprot:COSAG05_NODE_530_length_8907_cov_8.972298_3_plen_62_part_00
MKPFKPLKLAGMVTGTRSDKLAVAQYVQRSHRCDVSHLGESLPCFSRCGAPSNMETTDPWK